MADALVDLERTKPRVNFIPCLAWVSRGVARPVPERVKLTEEELASIIEQTKGELDDLKNAEEDGDVKEEESDNTDGNMVVENGEGEVKSEETSEVRDGVPDIVKAYNLDSYDDEEESAQNMLGIGDLTVYSDPAKDPYLAESSATGLDEDDQEDEEDFNIRPTDNMLLVGHVEDDAATVEVYVYNDVEDALYVHHDIILPSFPLALEWLSFDPESDNRGNLVAVGSMNPVIEVWDLDIVDCLEPAFKLGRKARKKKKIAGVGHKDAVLALAWNKEAEHVLASGSVDQTVVLWDMNGQSVASTLRSHGEKVQSLCWHHREPQTLLTGCCDKLVRVYDCRAQDSYKSWRVSGEVEKVLWDHFNPYNCLASTDSGTVHCIDVRKDAPLWTLAAHTEEVTGMSLSSQCPGCLTTVSQDKTMKVWDISGDQPQFVTERNVKVGAIQAVVGCPDAPFVVGLGGDKSGDSNLKVMDIRDSADVRQRFGSRTLLNPLGTADFGFSTADEAEPAQEMETDLATSALESMNLSKPPIEVPVLVQEPPKPSGGAAGKFKKKNKDKKKKKKEF